MRSVITKLLSLRSGIILESTFKELSRMADELRPLVICGPSGSGKSTILKKMLEDFPDNFGFSVSHTTRTPRPGEVDGRHYHFIDVDTMKKNIADGLFIENAIYGDNYYGTSKAAVEAIQQAGKVCVLDIDVQGVKQVKESSLNPWGVFIKPPSLDELKNRLITRKTESEESLSKRLRAAEEEINYGVAPGNFDAIIVNDNLDVAYNALKEFIQKNVLKRN